MRDDLGVGFGREGVALRLELALQFEVILDDAVVHDDDAPRAVAVGMGIFLGWPAVRRPSRVADAIQAVNRPGLDLLLEVGELARRSAQGDALRTYDRHARGVVAAIFHPPQSVEQHGHNRPRTDVPNDSAHTPLPIPDSDVYAFVDSAFFRVAHPSTFSCRPLAMPSAPGGTSLVIEEPAPT